MEGENVEAENAEAETEKPSARAGFLRMKLEYRESRLASVIVGFRSTRAGGHARRHAGGSQELGAGVV